MLQIIGGKFFRPVKLSETLHRAVFYTNYRSLQGEPMDVSVTRLFPSTMYGGLSTMTCEVIERQEGIMAPGALVSTIGEELMDDFGAVVSFALGITFTRDRDLARRLMAENQPLQRIVPPRKYLRRMFDSEVRAAEGDAARLVAFFNDLIALDRQTFDGAIRAIRRYVLGTHRMADEISLAYALFVVSIESLVQSFDGRVASWADYEEAVFG